MPWYLLIFISVFWEGELTLIAAGFAIRQGALNGWALVPIAWIAAFLGDWFFFELGRRRGDQLLAKWPFLGKRAQRLGGFMQRFPTLTLFVLRFQMGLRMIGNFSLGSGGLNRVRYLVINSIACLLWSGVIIYICTWFAGFMTGIWSSINQ